MAKRINEEYCGISLEEIQAAEFDTIQKVRQFREVYNDPAKTKDDLKDSAKAAIRSLNSLVKVQREQMEAILSVSLALADMVQEDEPKRPKKLLN